MEQEIKTDRVRVKEILEEIYSKERAKKELKLWEEGKKEFFEGNDED